MNSALTARDVMTTDVLVAVADWPVARLAEFLVEHAISGAPVVSEEGHLVGVVSLTDIVRHDSLPQKEPQNHAAHDYYVMALEGYAEEDVSSFSFEGDSEVQVRDIMTPTLFKVSPDTGLPDIADLMVKGRIHRVFVTEGKSILGLISTLDMLKGMRDH